jgi:hypothetical protein
MFTRAVRRLRPSRTGVVFRQQKRALSTQKQQDGKQEEEQERPLFDDPYEAEERSNEAKFRRKRASKYARKAIPVAAFGVLAIVMLAITKEQERKRKGVVPEMNGDKDVYRLAFLARDPEARTSTKVKDVWLAKQAKKKKKKEQQKQQQQEQQE